jgi:arylsulfatase A-like enzyme
MLAIWLCACSSQEEQPQRDPSVGDTSTAESTTAETGDSASAPPRPPNVLVLLTDDQGTDSVGVYGEHPHPPPTPHIDQLAAEGVLFRNAWSYPVCSPARAALLTGRLGRRTGIGDVIQYRDAEELPVSEVIIPRMLQSSPVAWSSAAIGKWHLSSYGSAHDIGHPVDLGFDAFTGSVNNLGDHVIADGQDHGYDHWEQVLDGELVKNDTYATTFAVDEALAAMRRLPEPWFIYVAFHAPHSPFDVPPDSLTPTLDAAPTAPKAERYPLLVEALDQEIGRLLDTMGDVRERTLVVFASDNGTPEDAVLPPWLPYRAKNSPFEGGVNVPLIVSGPMVSAPGRESEALVHLADVFRTVADVAGASVDPTLPLDSHSLLPLLVDPQAVGARDVVHTEKFLPNGFGPKAVDWRMSRGPRFKVIEMGLKAPLGVFDLSVAPVEVGNPLNVEGLTAEEQAEVQDLFDAHEAFFRSLE